MPLISAFEWDDENEQHVSRHGLSPDEVDDVLMSRVAIFRNKRAGSGLYQLIGRRIDGRFVTVIIEPTLVDSSIWRPITAWLSSTAERNKARRQGI